MTWLKYSLWGWVLAIWLGLSLVSPSLAQSVTPTPLPIVAQLTPPITPTIPITAVTVLTAPTVISTWTVLSTTYPITFTPPLTWLNITVSSTQRLLYIDQSRQSMYLYENGLPLRTIHVSTGKPTSRTLTKAWQGVVGKDLGAINVNYGFKVDYSWQLYRDLYGNILIHSVPYTQAHEIKYYDRPDALGLEPTSHGCIRISDEDAAWLKTWNPVSATIEINRWPGPIEMIK